VSQVRPEAELKGSAHVGITVKVDGPGKVTDAHASPEGHIHADFGTTMSDALFGQAW
jgi:hypothetical protein